MNDPKLKEKIKEEIKEYMELNDTGEMSQSILWDTLKAVMRGELISIISHLKKGGAKISRSTGKMKTIAEFRFY